MAGADQRLVCVVQGEAALFGDVKAADDEGSKFTTAVSVVSPQARLLRLHIGDFYPLVSTAPVGTQGQWAQQSCMYSKALAGKKGSSGQGLIGSGVAAKVAEWMVTEYQRSHPTQLSCHALGPYYQAIIDQGRLNQCHKAALCSFRRCTTSTQELQPLCSALGASW